MGRGGRSPALHLLSLGIVNHQRGTGQFLPGGDVLLGNIHLDGVILHVDGLNFAGGQHGKINSVRDGIAQRCADFGQRVIACGQLLNVVGRGSRNPALHLLPLGIVNHQRGTGQLLPGGDVLLGNVHLDGIVFHHNGGIGQQCPIVPCPEQEIVRGEQIHIGLLQRAACLIGFLHQPEHHAVGKRIAVCGPGFGEGVGFAKVQPGDAVRCGGRNPFLHQIAVCIPDGERCPRQFFLVGQVPLGNKTFGGLVIAGYGQQLERLAVRYKDAVQFGFVHVVAQRCANLPDKVLSAVGGGIVRGAGAVQFSLNGQIYLKFSQPLGIRLRGCQQCARIEQQHTIIGIDGISGVQIEHRTCQPAAGFPVCLDGGGAGLLPLVAELQGLLLHQCGIGILAVRHLILPGDFLRAVPGDGFRHNDLVGLAVPCKGHIIAVGGPHISVGRFGFLNVVAAQRQSDAHFPNGAIVDHTQKVIGGLCASGGKADGIAGPVTGAYHGNHISRSIPESAVSESVLLAVLRVNILCGGDGVLGTRQRALLIAEIAALGLAGHAGVQDAARRGVPAGQHLAGLADRQPAQRFGVVVFLANHQRVHAVLVLVAGGLINPLGGNGKVHIVSAVCGPFVEETVGAAHLHNAVMAQRQLFRQGQDTVLIGVEGGNILGQMAVPRVRHGHKFAVAAVIGLILAVFIQPIDLKRRIRQQDRFAGFLVQLGDAQIDLDFLIQHRVLLVGIRAGHDAVLRGCHAAPRVVILCRVNAHKERLGLIHVLRRGGFHHQIGAVGQTLYPDIAGVTAENFRKPVFIGDAGGNPAAALAVPVLARCGQRSVVGADFRRVDLIRFGDGLRFAGEIPLGMRMIVVRVQVG